jgi:CheY-like chemotaxis protein
MNEPKKILVVDRSRQDRRQLLDLLTRYGYRVLETGSPPEAFGILRDGSVDLLMVEVGTAGVEEETMIKEMRSTSSFMEVPVIVLATTEEVGDVAGSAAGATTFCSSRSIQGCFIKGSRPSLRPIQGHTIAFHAMSSPKVQRGQSMQAEN